MIQGLIMGWVLFNSTVCLCKSEEGAWQIQCTNTGDEKSERAMESTWLQVPALAGHGRVADPIIAQSRACSKIFPWHTNISCWNLVCSNYPILIKKPNFHSVQIWYVKFLWSSTDRWNLSSSFSIYKMIAHNIAHPHCTEKVLLLHFAVHIKTLPLHTLYPRLLFDL
jgi:hypothetical protein